ncbi:DUF1015 domain-containing protein [bacterium]|nr:DUF1015 domain-containing protein [bacterium]
MVTVRSFRGIRPQDSLAEKVASYPYDVLNSEEARELTKNDPYSFLHVVKPEIDLPKDVDLYDESVYQQAKKNFDKMVAEGWMQQDKEPHLYIYRQIWNGHVQYGIVGAASADEYNNNIIKKHEFTRKKKEDDRTKHVMTLNANAGPVFLTYRDNKNIDELVSEWSEKKSPQVDFTADDGIQHTVWVIDDTAVSAQLSALFKEEVPVLYVADGHHRSASAARVKAERLKHDANPSEDKAYNYFLCVFFPANQLKILDYNRVLFTMNGLTKEQFLEKTSESFEVIRSGKDRPDSAKEFALYIDGEWITLRAKEGTYSATDPVGSLDVALLQNNLLAPILGIGDPRSDQNIDFVGGIRGTEELKRRVDSGECTMAFTLYPPSIDQLMNVADAGKVMPPKSTWFEPKLRSGLIVHSLD